jgi:glycine C-acetyltransferase
MLGKSKLAQKFGQMLFGSGVFGLPIVFPMVAKDRARIRTMVTAEHTKKDIDEALEIIEGVGRKLRVV